MITLPLARADASTNDATIQPTAGSSAAATVPTPQPQPAQVTSTTRASTTAISGDGAWLYWKLPIPPSSTPSTNSSR